MKKRTVIIILALIVSVAAAAIFWPRSKENAMTYKDAKVERGNITRSVLATGTVQPENRLEIKPPIAGRIEEVLVKEGQKIRKGQILAWMSSTERAALMDGAREKGPEELKRWQDLYRPTPIVAPINGMLILRNVEAGQSFTATDAILVMSDRLTVKAQVDETDIAQIKVKQPAEIILDAYSSEKFPATVDQVAYEAKTVNNVTTYVIDVLPDKPIDFMRSGMTANVTFFVESKENVLLIPSDALKLKDGRSTVLVKSNDDQPVEKDVTIGISDGKHYEIIDGLSEGDIILVAQIAKKSRAKPGSNPFAPSMGGSRGGRGH